MSKIEEILREYTAPLEYDYGTTTYDAVVKSIEIKVREAIAEEQKFIWRLGWQKDGRQVYTFYGSNCAQGDMENACERIAMSLWKRPVTLERVVQTKAWL